VKIRTRITIDEDVYKAAVKYSKLDNRTFSQLMQEAVKRMMHRFPKKNTACDLDRLQALEKVVDKLIEEVSWRERKTT